MRPRSQALAAIGGLFFALGASLDAQCHFEKSLPSQTITYRFDPEIAQNTLVLHVTVDFQTGRDGTRTLVLPNQWAGETLHSVTGVHAVSKGATLEDGANADTKILHGKPNHRVLIAYDRKRDWTGLLAHPMQFHLTPQYFEFTGSNALVVPKLDSAADQTVHFDWRKLPGAWALATSFGTTLSDTGRCQSHSGHWIDVEDGLYAAGDYRIHRFQVGARPVVLAVRGQWTFTDEYAIAQISTVIAAVRSFWHDDNFPYFLVTLKPYDEDHGDSDGSAFTNAFWMYVSRLDSLAGILPQLAHESFHAWDPKKMGLIPESDEDSVKWFREGPTDYYARLLTFMAGYIPESAYVASLNDDLRKFPASDSEYVRGRIISLWLDGTIRKESHGRYSLDDVMHDMVHDASRPLTLERILATCGHYLSGESTSALRRAVTEHADLPAPKEIPGVTSSACPEMENVFTFDLGLDLRHSRESGKVAGVVPKGQALDGRVSVYKGDPDKLALFTIRAEDGGHKEIAFYPRGERISVWQYHVGPSDACR